LCVSCWVRARRWCRDNSTVCHQRFAERGSGPAPRALIGAPWQMAILEWMSSWRQWSR
jgi:hypothetical protein